MLDNRDGDAVAVYLPDDTQHVFKSIVPKPGQRLVEQQHTRARRECAGKLHEPQLLCGKSAGDRVRLLVGQPDTIERGHRKALGFNIASRADEGTDDDVFQHSHARERTYNLKRSADALPADIVRLESCERCAGKGYVAAVSGEKAINYIE